MEEMTAKMQDVADRTEKETVSMRITWDFHIGKYVHDRSLVVYLLKDVADLNEHGYCQIRGEPKGILAVSAQTVLARELADDAGYVLRVVCGILVCE